jgi:hypothetical protein
MDEDIAEQERAKGCVHCGGKLHKADYPRSPYGVPKDLREHYETRCSYCCSGDECRKRTTAPSVRFFGRRWFPEFLHLLISALMIGAVRHLKKCCKQLDQLFGISISPKTCKRWKHWWGGFFLKTNFWKAKAGIIPPDRLGGPFPRRLFSLPTEGPGAETVGEAHCPSVGPPSERRLVWVHTFLAPLTAELLRSV